MYICPRCLEKNLCLKYSNQFANAALFEARHIMLKNKAYNRLYNLRYKHKLFSKVLFWLNNIFDSYHHLEIERVELAEHLIQLGQIKWLVQIPNTVMSYRWLDWYQYNLMEDNLTLY